MAFLTALVGVVDSSLNYLAPASPDGTRLPVLVEIGDNLTVVGRISGGFSVVRLSATGLGTGTAGDDAHGARGFQTLGPPAVLLHPLATTTDPGFMSAADKTKLDLLGAWTEAPTVVGPTAIVVEPYTLYPCDVSAGNVTLEIPDAAANGGAEFRFVIVAGTNDVNVDGSGTPGQNVQLGGSIATTLAFNAGSYVFVSLQALAASTTWYVTGYT